MAEEETWLSLYFSGDAPEEAIATTSNMQPLLPQSYLLATPSWRTLIVVFRYAGEKPKTTVSALGAEVYCAGVDILESSDART